MSMMMIGGATVAVVQSDKDGKPCEAQTFDDFQLEVTTPKRQPVGSKETGGPRDAPARARDPARI